MLNKTTVLQELNKAKVAHTRWVKRAEHLIEGFPVDKEFIPLESTSCVFGKWLYEGSGMQLRINEEFKEIIEQIEFYHDALHDNYAKIYQLYFIMPEKRSLLQKIMTFNSKTITAKEKEEALYYFGLLKKNSKSLLELLDRFEKKIRATSSFDKFTEVD